MDSTLRPITLNLGFKKTTKYLRYITNITIRFVNSSQNISKLLWICRECERAEGHKMKFIKSQRFKKILSSKIHLIKTADSFNKYGPILEYAI